VTDETSNRITYDASNGDSLFITSTDIQAVQTAPPPVISAQGDHGLLWAIHPDGRVELGDGYTPDEAATSFWETVQRLAGDSMTREFGAPLKARINAELAAGQNAQKQVERLDQMASAWLERLPNTIRTATAVEAIHHVTRGDAG
jgi:hypothetical protein